MPIEDRLRAAAEATCSAHVDAECADFNETQPHVFSSAFEKEIEELIHGTADTSSRQEESD